MLLLLSFLSCSLIILHQRNACLHWNKRPHYPSFLSSVVSHAYLSMVFFSVLVLYQLGNTRSDVDNTIADEDSGDIGPLFLLDFVPYILWYFIDCVALEIDWPRELISRGKNESQQKDRHYWSLLNESFRDGYFIRYWTLDFNTPVDQKPLSVGWLVWYWLELSIHSLSTYVNLFSIINLLFFFQSISGLFPCYQNDAMTPIVK